MGLNAYSPAACNALLMTSNGISGQVELLTLQPENMKTYISFVTPVSLYFIIMAGNFEAELLNNSAIDI